MANVAAQNAEQTLSAILKKRQDQHLFRELFIPEGLVDFCSNDYLGLARSALLRFKTQEAVAENKHAPTGSTGSRLITGDSHFIRDLEAWIAAFHRAPAGLIFNSGYDANLGCFSAIPQSDDIIFFDEMIHASVRDGLKMTRGQPVAFRHNDLNDLEEKLQAKAAVKYVAVESVYSMDGDFAPLRELVDLCHRHGANLIVDEAHATGIYGPQGEGRVVELGLEADIFMRVHTFGKALGCHGAILLCSPVVKSFLINFARPFIYTTALPIPGLLAVKCAYDIMSVFQHKSLFTSKLSIKFKSEVAKHFPNSLIPADGFIQSVLIPGNERARSISAVLREEGFYCKAILYPTVPVGKERLRVCFHSFNTAKEVDRVTGCLIKLLK